MRFFVYLGAYLFLAGFHLSAISYPEGAWSDDWLGYYGSSARWRSSTGPMEVGRQVMVEAFDASRGTARDLEVALAVFNTADPYLGWGMIHAFLSWLFSLAPDFGFLMLHLLAVAFYLLSLKGFAQTCFSELASFGSSRDGDTKRLTPIVVLLQMSYLGNPLLIGPAIFNPAMFVLPLALMFFALLPDPSRSWLRIVILGLMVIVHSSGIIFAMACLCASLLYGIVGAGSRDGEWERFRSFLKEALGVVVLFSVVVGAGALRWIPSPYPLSARDFGFGFDVLGIQRIWRFVGMGIGVIAFLSVPMSLLAWRQSGRRLFPLPIVLIVWIVLGIFSLTLLLPVQIWTKQQPALVRFMYAGWPLLLASVFLALVWFVSRPSQRWSIRVVMVAAALLLVSSNLRGGVRFHQALSHWRSGNNCRFLFEPTQAEIRNLSKLSGGFVIVFSSRAAGSMSFVAGAGDHPVFYTRLTPDWKQRVDAYGSRFVLVIAPVTEYLSPETFDPREAPSPDGNRWKAFKDELVSRKGALRIHNGSLAVLAAAARELSEPNWGCDGPSGAVYRITVFERAASPGALT